MSNSRAKSSTTTGTATSGGSATQNSSRQSARSPRTQSRGTAGIRESVHSQPQQEKRKIVGQYMIGKTIGEGTFGKVKLAVHIPTGEKVAIKILEKNRIKEQADVRRVNREIKILKKSRHGNVIQLYEVLDTQNTIYLIMECAEGGEMFDYIVAQKHVPEIQACNFFHQIIDGVEVLHQNEVTHRDLKPENLLLKASPSGWLIKIVDFGLSNTHEGGRLLSTACGSPCYAAPEMIAGKKYNGPLADIWSLGVILFALVCGYLPFEDANTSILYKKILSGDYSPPRWISSNVKDLIRRILETDPRKRFTILDIRKHSWYQTVPDSDIPKEEMSLDDTIKMRDEIVKSIANSGIDTQAVLDGVASHACNSLTAMYHLLEQKYKTVRKTNGPARQTIQPTDSNVSNTTTASHRPESTMEGAVANHGKNMDEPLPSLLAGQPLLPLVNKGNANTVTFSNQARSPIAAGAVTTNPKPSSITPYLQPPSILGYQSIQHQTNLQNKLQQHQNVPNLDQYLQSGMTAAIPVESNDQQQLKGNVVTNHSHKVQTDIGNSVGGAAALRVPRLNIVNGSPTSTNYKYYIKPNTALQPIPIQSNAKPVVNETHQINNTLISQSARNPSSNIQKGVVNEMNSLSARPAQQSVLPNLTQSSQKSNEIHHADSTEGNYGSIDDSSQTALLMKALQIADSIPSESRPNTRRSHTRGSREGGTRPGTATRETDEKPMNNETVEAALGAIPYAPTSTNQPQQINDQKKTSQVVHQMPLELHVNTVVSTNNAPVEVPVHQATVPPMKLSPKAKNIKTGHGLAIGNDSSIPTSTSPKPINSKKMAGGLVVQPPEGPIKSSLLTIPAYVNNGNQINGQSGNSARRGRNIVQGKQSGESDNHSNNNSPVESDNGYSSPRMLAAKNKLAQQSSIPI